MNIMKVKATNKAMASGVSYLMRHYAVSGAQVLSLKAGNDVEIEHAEDLIGDGYVNPAEATKTFKVRDTKEMSDGK